MTRFSLSVSSFQMWHVLYFQKHWYLKGKWAWATGTSGQVDDTKGALPVCLHPVHRLLRAAATTLLLSPPAPHISQHSYTTRVALSAKNSNSVNNEPV